MDSKDRGRVKVVVKYPNTLTLDTDSIAYSVEMNAADLSVLLTSETIVLSRTMVLVGNTVVMELSVRSLVDNG